MKRTDMLTKLVTLLLFGAMLAYLSVYIVRSITYDVRTAPAVYISLTESASATGIVVRDEQLIASSDTYLSVVADNGALLAAGDTIAVAYANEEALSRAAQIRELEIKQKYILSVLSEVDDSENLSRREDSIKDSIIELSAAAARAETDRLTAASLNLGSLVMDNLNIETTEVDLRLITTELNNLRQVSVRDTVAITADFSGLFSSAPDGYEYIRPRDVSNLDPEALRQLISAPQELPEDVRGKLVSPYEWYFVSVISEEDASRLRVGGSALMDFGRYCSAPIEASVISISTPKKGECTVLFRCTRFTSEMLSVRRATAEIIFATREGIRVPREAVRSDEGGPYVYTLTGLQAEKKYITIAWETEEYFLAVSSADAASLRVGNEIILTDGEIYDGQLMK
ncbi:MAG: hypothetical protein KIG37_01400 [Oscillospiraceae bacterium]|nr:hypothetical protein [Oscillospiraceae bacterium]